MLNNKDTSVIPKGYYCYTHIDDKEVHCPYWSILENMPEHENGYCSYLEKSDYDRNEDLGESKWLNKDGEVIDITQPHEIPLSMLWDQCKECDINHYTEEEYEDILKVEYTLEDGEINV
jgi:hypothetical protein